jgi:hypothetical protein
MKRNIRKHMKLGDVIRIVSQLSRNDHEASVVLADMVNRGLIKFSGPMRHHKVVIR